VFKEMLGQIAPAQFLVTSLIEQPIDVRNGNTAKPGSRSRGYSHNEQGWRYNEGSQMMSKILVLAASVAVAFVSVATTTGADARHARHTRHHASRGFHAYYGYAPRYHAPRRFYQSPMYAPNAPPPRSYNNPGIPDFQLGSRG
jgi:hypothetical protein